MSKILNFLVFFDVLQYFTIKMSEGVVATSYSSGDKFFIDPMKLLPLERFLPRPKGAPGSAGGRGGTPCGQRMGCILIRSQPTCVQHAHGIFCISLQLVHKYIALYD